MICMGGGGGSHSEVLRWADGCNLTLFALITHPITHKNISDICLYKPYTQTKIEKKKQLRKKYKPCTICT